MLLFGAAAAAGAAVIGAGTAVLVGQSADERLNRGYVAITKALVTMPRPDVPEGHQRHLVLVRE